VQAREISEKLNRLNQKRQRIQKDIYDEALEQIEGIGTDQKLYFAWGDEWAEGVIGIVAGKISENFKRPVLVATKTESGYKGSARSIEEFNIINAINSQSDLLEHFGGHPLAAGFTVKAENIEQFRDNLLEIADRELTDEKIEKELVAEAEIELRDINWDSFEWIERFAPFGYGNLKPRFILKNVELADISRVGTDGAHLKIALLNKDTGEYTGGIGFRLGEEFAHLRLDDKIDILFTLEVNEWNGSRKLQLNIKDLKQTKLNEKQTKTK
jgi:single-stranded-DNA-specific exonuclease